MLTKKNHITVFEHQTIKLNQIVDDVRFDEKILNAFQVFFGNNRIPYFSLIHNGIKFSKYVGVIQVGEIVVEVLPKADKKNISEGDVKYWRDILIDMLFAVGAFEINAPSSSSLKIKPDSLLDLYFELFLNEVEYLYHNGLVKKYRIKEGNVTSLKGSLQFGKHIQKNHLHHERFYVRFTTYDIEHKLHFILYKTIKLIARINTSNRLKSRIGYLLLNFPEMPDLVVTADIFDKIVYNRKTLFYKKAINIARLLLLRYYPDISKGNNDVLAIMFDMNDLWEQFIYSSLKKYLTKNDTISAQSTKYFWKPEFGNRSKIIADIVINLNKEECVVIDTKWKNLNGYNPSPEDLRQIYVYHEYYNAKYSALIYPGVNFTTLNGYYLHPVTAKKIDKQCSIISIPVESKIKEWQKNIYKNYEDWIHSLKSSQ